MFEGDLQNGELEIGQIAGIMDELLSAEQIILDLVQEFNDAQYELAKISMK
jgi:enoyl-[acyl-carrier protein] reductase II